MSDFHQINEPPHQVFWTIVLEKWLVSTIHRQSSVQTSTPHWFYEVHVYEWNPVTKRAGNDLIYKGSGLAHHWEVCRKLFEGKDLENEDHVKAQLEIFQKDHADNLKKCLSRIKELGWMLEKSTGDTCC